MSSESPDASKVSLSENYDKATTIVGRVWDESQHLIGILLTLADATGANKAYKDLVKREVRQVHERIQHWVYTELGVEDDEFRPQPAEPVSNEEE